MAELKIQVKAADVALYLTLSETLLRKSLDAAVLKPFVKAYNKRADANETLDTILSLTLTGAKADGPVARATASDDTVTAASILGDGESVVLTVEFPPRIEQTPGWETMSEVEKLKARRRAENAAKRAAAGDAATPEPAAERDPAPEAPPAAAPLGALGAISEAESKLAALLVEISAVSALVDSAADSAALDAAAKRQAAATAGVGALMAKMDEIDLGEIEDDEARSEARARRKAINKRCALASSGDVEVDGDLAAASAALKSAVVAARKRIA